MGNEESKLIKAAEKGDLSTVQELVQNKVNIDCQDSEGFTPLHKAAAYNHLEVVKYLLRQGANPNSFNKNEKTPLYIPVMNQNIEMVQYLVNHGTMFRSWDDFVDAGIKEMKKEMVLDFLGLLVTGDPIITTIIACLLWKGKFKEIMIVIRDYFLTSDRFVRVARIISNPPPEVSRIRELIDSFTNIPITRKTGGKFRVSSFIWEINTDLAIINLEEIIRLLNHYIKIVDWISLYYGTFVFGLPLQNDGDHRGTIACTNGETIELGTTFFTMTLEEFRQTSQQNQNSQWHVPANIPELQTIRHEFGHIFQFLLQNKMAEKNPAYRDLNFFANKIKEYLINKARLRGWDRTARRMSSYGNTSKLEWFAESFANAQNVMDVDLNDQDDELLNEARIVGELAEDIATDIGLC